MKKKFRFSGRLKEGKEIKVVTPATAASGQKSVDSFETPKEIISTNGARAKADGDDDGVGGNHQVVLPSSSSSSFTSEDKVGKEEKRNNKDDVFK